MNKSSFFNKRKPQDIVTDASEIENSGRVIRKSTKLSDDNVSPLNPSSLKRSFFENKGPSTIPRRQEFTNNFSEKLPSASSSPEVFSMNLSRSENFNIDESGGSVPATLGILFPAAHTDSVERQSSNAIMTRIHPNIIENLYSAGVTYGVESQPVSTTDSVTTKISENLFEHAGLFIRPEPDALQQITPATPSPTENLKTPHYPTPFHQQPQLVQEVCSSFDLTQYKEEVLHKTSEFNETAKSLRAVLEQRRCIIQDNILSTVELDRKLVLADCLSNAMSKMAQWKVTLQEISSD